MNEDVELRVGAEGTVIRNWSAYEFNSDFTTPTDGWSFHAGESDLRPDDASAIIAGAPVSLYINQYPQATGYIDKIERTAGKSGGIEWTVSGRDVMAGAVDGHIDPRLQFKPNMSLVDIVLKALQPLGRWNDFLAVQEGNEANLAQQTGKKLKFTKSGRVAKKATAAQLKSTINEGAFAFCARVLMRHGLWMWPSADGSRIIIGKPTFDIPSPPAYVLTRRFDGVGNNIESGGGTIDLSDQPTVLVVEGFAGGGEFGKSKCKAFMLNPFLRLKNKSNATVAGEIMSKFKGARWVKPDFELSREPIVVEQERLLYKHDQDAQTQEELEAYIHLHMSEYTRRFMTARYTVKGHTFGGAPWAVDTVVHVQDEVSGINEPMWVLSRTFSKSRSAGTKTTLNLIGLNTLSFGGT